MPQCVGSILVVLHTWLITWYCACLLCCGKPRADPAYGFTASGHRAYSGLTVACDRKLLHREVWIEGLGLRRCDDTGRLVSGRHIDVYVLRHDEAVRLGRQRRKVGLLP